MDEPDPLVIAAAKGGDPAAFERLVRRYQPNVWRLCFHLLNDETAADDATQDAFVRAFRFIRRYRGESKFSTWLFSIARNCALDEVRRAVRRRRVSEKLESQPPGPQIEQGAAIEVREALAALPLSLREPVVLIDMFGLSYRDVATMLEVAEGTVKSRVHRAREQLAATLIGSDAGSADEI